MKRLLVIDDDKRIRDVIKVQLQKMDIEINEAENHPEALSLLEGKEMDVVLCDIKMKDTDGITVLKEIKAAYPSLPVIMLSGFIDKQVSDRARDEGCFDFITKPVKRGKLIEIINKALDK